jgi:hypothetical protein
MSRGSIGLAAGPAGLGTGTRGAGRRHCWRSCADETGRPAQGGHAGQPRAGAAADPAGPAAGGAGRWRWGCSPGTAACAWPGAWQPGGLTLLACDVSAGVDGQWPGAIWQEGRGGGSRIELVLAPAAETLARPGCEHGLGRHGGPGVHRCGQGQLSRVLRTGPGTAASRRAGARGQHALVRKGGRPGSATTRIHGPSGSWPGACTTTPASSPPLLPDRRRVGAGPRKV